MIATTLRYSLLIALTIFPLFSVAADDVPVSTERSQEVIKEVFAGPDFHSQQTISSIRPRDAEEGQTEEETPEWLIRLIEWLEGIEVDASDRDDGAGLLTLVKLLELALWLLAIAVVVWLLYRYRYLLTVWSNTSAAEKVSAPAPEVMFGFDLRAESLPDDVPDQVLKLWQADKQREAIGLLYRACLSKLIHDFKFEFYDGHTERECAAIVARRKNTALTTYINSLTDTWSRLAYAHRLPADSQVQQLCQMWPQIFSAGDSE